MDYLYGELNQNLVNLANYKGLDNGDARVLVDNTERTIGVDLGGLKDSIAGSYVSTSKDQEVGGTKTFTDGISVAGTTKLLGGFEPIKSYTAQGQYETNSGYQTLPFTLNIFAETPINKLEHSFFGSIEILNAKYICNGLYSLDGEGNLHSIGCLITLENAYGVNIMKCTYFNNDIRIMRIADYHDVENWNDSVMIVQEALKKVQPKLYPHTLTLTADKSYTLVYQSTDKTEVISVEKLRTIMNVASATDNVILPVCATDLSGTAVLQVTTSVCKIGTADVTAVSDSVPADATGE